MTQSSSRLQLKLPWLACGLFSVLLPQGQDKERSLTSIFCCPIQRDLKLSAGKNWFSRGAARKGEDRRAERLPSEYKKTPGGLDVRF